MISISSRLAMHRDADGVHDHEEGDDQHHREHGDPADRQDPRDGQELVDDLRVVDETYDAIRRIAHDSKRNVSDVVREAIRRYVQAS